MSCVVVGANGRMGQSIVKILESSDLPFSTVSRNNSLTDIDESAAQVVIDFSSPQFFDEVLNWCVLNSIAFVSGTTGLSSKQFSDIQKASLKIPVLWAPNMSIGVAFVNKLLKNYKELANDFDFQIEEIHHNKKVDQPSGTGILLQNTLKQTLGKELPEVLSIRGGGVYGVHKIFAMSDDEVITLEHQAINRDVFAKGAIKCSLWLQNKKPGLYQIEDLL